MRRPVRLLTEENHIFKDGSQASAGVGARLIFDQDAQDGHRHHASRCSSQ